MIKRTWISDSKIQYSHINYEIKQIYGWISTDDNKIIIVSKDNKKWQLPGGKPENNDINDIECLKREINEECGLDINLLKTKINMIGYYIIEGDGEPYLQVRYLIKIHDLIKQSNLYINEPSNIEEKDKINYINIIDLIYIKEYIPRAEGSLEFEEFIKRNYEN